MPAPLDLWPRVSQPKELNLSGNVVLKTKLEKTGDTRTLQTSCVSHGIQRWRGARAEQAAKGRDTGRRHHGMDRLRGASRAELHLRQEPSSRPTSSSMDFADTGKARQLQANGNVQTERWMTGHPVQTATASERPRANGSGRRLVADGSAR